MKKPAYPTIDNTENLMRAMSEIRKAQAEFSVFNQEDVDRIFHAAAAAAVKERIPLAELAREETDMGVTEDKVIKNNYAAEYIYNAYKDTKTCGLIYEDKYSGIKRYAEPMGVIAAIIPTTNPTSTAIFKCLLAIKTRNAIVLSPHPKAKASTIAAAKIIAEAAEASGAPHGIIRWIDAPSLDMTNALMKECDLVLATGGPAMVKAAYSSSTPAIGVGSGNTPALIDESADIILAVNSIIHSKTFDNGMICASEQAVIVPESIHLEVKKEFAKRGCHFLNSDEIDLVRDIIMQNGRLNADIVGKDAVSIAKMAGFELPEYTKLLIAEAEKTDASEPFAHEKLSPILAMYITKDFSSGVSIAEELLRLGGMGHTSAIYIDEIKEKEKLSEFENRMKTCRILINTPSSQGGVGDIYNFKLAPSLTLGCGTWGGNSTGENVGVYQLLNIKTVADRRENMLWLKVPERMYIKKGCLPHALRELKRDMHKSRAMIVTDRFLHEGGYIKPLCDSLDELDIEHSVFFDVQADPTLENVKNGAKAISAYKPDTIIAIGGGSAMDAAKIMWLLYEHPEVSFDDMSMRFMDIRKKIYTFPKMGKKAYFAAVPTTAGTGSELTPFAVITDEESGIKYPIADYELLPNMAIIDIDYQMSAPKSLTAASGIDTLTHAIEAYASMLATDYTDALAVNALKILFEYLPRAYDRGDTDTKAREKMANAAAMAGMAFANAFLGVCHSMAHKLGAFHHLPHGVANALLIEEVMRFNSSPLPTRMGSFPQYTHPHALERYASLADALGLGGSEAEEKLELLISHIKELKAKLGIKSSIREYGIDEKAFAASLDEMARLAFDDQCTPANPRYPMIHEIKQMYLNAY